MSSLQSSTKSGTSTLDTASNAHDSLFEKKKATREKIIERWICADHSLPDKPSACWHHTNHPGICYPLTIGNINYWVSLIVSYSDFVFCTDVLNTIQLRNPEAYNENEKPSEINLTPSYRSPASRPPPQQQPMQMQMPYPFYPPPHMYLPQQSWPMNPQPVPSTSEPTRLHQNPLGWPKLVKGPAISAWLQHCDNHPDRHGDNLSTLAANFDTQGYRTIDQLTSGRMSIENLSSWVNIGKGTADYIIQYADEDMALVIDGKFVMLDQPNVNDTGNGDWAY